MNIAVIGTGAWGTALAIHFARHGHTTVLLGRQDETANELNRARINERYLPGIGFPEALGVSADWRHATEAACVIVATPVAGLREAVGKLAALGLRAPILAACKGLEADSGLLPHEVIESQYAGCAGLLSGPSFARELAQGLPCAVCIATREPENAAWLSGSLNTSTLRLYANTDVTGVAVGGAVKNVMAIATGVADGLDYGMNARAALMTRGLAEIGRLAQALGGHSSTLMGLAGMGDLILTCTGALSRNRTVGLKLATGQSLADIIHELGHVAEGVNTVQAVLQKAQAHGVDMPITQTVAHMLSGALAPEKAAQTLLLRATRFE